MDQKKTKTANLLWLYQQDSPDSSSFFNAFADIGIRVMPVLCDNTIDIDINLSQVKAALIALSASGPPYLPIGIAGISYGGFIAGHLLAESDVFAAGAIISGLTNPATAYGSCKGVTLPSSKLTSDFSLLDYMQELTKDSVVYHCDAIHAPLLLLHGFRDEIYGYEQAEQLFTSIKERQPKAVIRMVIFPEGADRLAEDPACGEKYEEELITWFAEKLKGEPHHDA